MAIERVQRQTDRLLDESEEAVSRLDWETVRDRSRAILAFDPDNADGLAFLAAAERGLGQMPESSPLEASQEGSPGPLYDVPTSFADGKY